MTDNPCNCEHIDHFRGDIEVPPTELGWLDPQLVLPEVPAPGWHEYMKVEAGQRRAMYVGQVCDACVAHLGEYMMIPGDYCAEKEENGTCIHSDHTR